MKTSRDFTTWVIVLLLCVAAQASASLTADDREFICRFLQLRADVRSAPFVDPRPRFLLSSRVRVHQLEARSRLR